MLMWRSTHERIVAGMARKQAGLLDRVMRFEADNRRLRIQLARFTGARQRDDKGRFLKGAGK